LAGKIVEQTWLVVSLESKGSAMLGHNSKHKSAKTAAAFMQQLPRAFIL